METYIVRINGTQYEVEIEKKAGGQSGGQTAGAQAASTQESSSAAAPQASSAAGTGTGEPVVCGTAGKVWKIEKSVGDQVDEGDTVMILEAMKMENPIRVPVACTLSRILVQPEDKVRIGQVLLEIEPDQPGAFGDRA